MNCPFCQIELMCNEYKSSKSYYCDSANCPIRGEMTRFRIAYDENSNLINMTLLSNELQIEQDYIKKFVSIAKLNVCVLEDQVYLSCILPFDFDDPESIFTRAKKLLVFS